MAKVLHTCTECVPIDASIIDTYVALVDINGKARTAEDERKAAETARESAEAERTATFAEDHSLAAADHAIAGEDHITADADHGRANYDHLIATADHETAAADHSASVSATARANEAAATAEHMVDIHQGPPGEQGEPGPAGPAGPAGPKGEKGDSTNTNPFKGFFSSSSSLETTYPEPLVGDYAYVKNGVSATTANIYSAVNGNWSDTGVPVGVTDYDSVFPRDAKMVLLSTLEKVAWVDAYGEGYLEALQIALLGSIHVESISAVFNPGTNVIYDTNTLDDLRQYLTVTATFSDSSVETVTAYTLSGTMSEGTQLISVAYLGKTTSFSVTVVHNYAGALSTWTLHKTATSSIATYSGGVITLLCGNATDVSNFNVWAADCKKTMWSAANGKTFKFRIKTNSIDISVLAFGVGIYQNSSITSLGAQYAKRKGFQSTDFTLAADEYYETTYTVNESDFTLGTLTPTSSSTFGIWCYGRSQTDYGRIFDAQVIEVNNG